MSKTMLYICPSTNKTSDAKKGFVKDREYGLVDYIVVKSEEVKACIKEGFSKTIKEAFEKHEDEKLKQSEEVKGAESNEAGEDEKLKQRYHKDLEKNLTVDQLKPLYTKHELKYILNKKEIKYVHNASEENLIKKAFNIK